MPEFSSPEKYYYKEQSAEKPASELVPEKSDDVTDEGGALRRIEERARRFPQAELSFLSLERNLDLVLSDNALEAYKKAHYAVENDAELPFFRLTDLASTLKLLERFKDRLPNRYQSNIMKLIQHADAIKQIFLDYRSIGENGGSRDLTDVSALLSALEQLQRIDPEKFPSDLVDVSPEERRQVEAMKGITLRANSDDEIRNGQNP